MGLSLESDLPEVNLRNVFPLRGKALVFDSENLELQDARGVSRNAAIWEVEEVRLDPSATRRRGEY